MHGSVCLFSRYLNHLLEGENLDELDISSASSSNNIFTNKKTLSTGWTGTCPLVDYFKDIYTNYSSELSSLRNIITSNHAGLTTSYISTNTLINNLYTVSYISSVRPSGLTTPIMPKSEYEFSDKTNSSLIGGKINSDFTNYLKNNVESLNSTIRTSINSFLNTDTYGKSLNDAYENFANFDITVATAANVMNKNILDLKNYFLDLQFVVMFFTWAYMFFFGVIVLLYIIYACKKYNILWYFIIILVHILLAMMLVEIFISSFFGQVRLICHEVPRAINFIFTGNYMVSGNSASYPAKFGTGNANMTKMFTSCLNGDGDLYNLFLFSNDKNIITNLRNSITSLYMKVKSIVDKSNIITNNYDTIENSIFLKGIIKLETMKTNLYMATEGFGNDDIYNILNNIRTNLDQQNCSMTTEFYVIRAADCPAGSVESTTIFNTTGVIHCYLIQNLESTTSAAYISQGCDNNYINNAIAYIKEINTLIDTRINQLKLLQDSYSALFDSFIKELTLLSNSINSTYDQLDLNLASSSIANCGSSRFDLIDFCDFIGDTTEYDARIVVIFAAFVGVFGYVILYSFLIVLNTFESFETGNNYDDYGYNFGKKKKRNINININKSKNLKKESNYYDNDEEEEYNDKYNKNKSKKQKVPSNTGQNVEMVYLSKNNENSDSS